MTKKDRSTWSANIIREIILTKNTRAMTVQTLRNILGMMPPDMEVLIQQGESDYDYVAASNVCEKQVIDMEGLQDFEILNDFVVIDFTNHSKK